MIEYKREVLSRLVARDGIWPTVWRWSATVRVTKLQGGSAMSEKEFLRGGAVTKARALRKMERAINTMEFR